MAEIDILAAFSGGGATLDYIIWGIILLVGTGVVAGLFILVRWLLKFDKEVTLLYPNSSGFKWVKDKAKEEKTPQGNTFWRFLKTKGPKNKPLRIKPPTKEYIDINKRGKDCCMFEMVSPDSPVPIHPTVKDPETKTLKESTISPDDRAWMISDIQDTNELHKDRSFAAVLEKALPIFAVVITVIMLVIFLNQFTESQSEIAGKVDSTMDKFVEVQKNQQEMMTQLMKFQQGKDITEADGGEPPN